MFWLQMIVKMDLNDQLLNIFFRFLKILPFRKRSRGLYGKSSPTFVLLDNYQIIHLSRNMVWTFQKFRGGCLIS